MKTIDPKILALLSELEITGSTVRIPRAIDYKTEYKPLDVVLQACGGKWDKKRKVHVFEGDAFERLDPVITSGQVLVPKNELAFFATPVPLAKQLVELAGVKSGDIVLEPSAGTGRLIDALLAAGAGVVFCERNNEMQIALYERLSASGALASAVVVDDFLDYDPRIIPGFRPFDAVVMNPPFAKIGKGCHLDHVQHAFALLKVGGVLAAILPRSVEFRQDRMYSAFREWVRRVGGELTRLPDGSFKESGTGVATNILRIEKRGLT